MDSERFDAAIRVLGAGSTRRGGLRLLAGAMLGAVLSCRGATSARAAQRPDRDGDGLYDDDETDVYGTNPDVYDTDGDGVGDGEEIYNRDNGLGGPSDPLTPDGGPAPVGCAPGLSDCGGVCVDLLTNNAHCGACGAACAQYVNCSSGNCGGLPDQPPPGTCAVGLTNCDYTCVDLLTNPYHCGACRNTCPPESTCQGGSCTLQPVCPAGQARCGGYCSDTLYDALNCGACGRACAAGLVCCGGACVDISSDPNNCGGCFKGCFTPIIGEATCENYRCT